MVPNTNPPAKLRTMSDLRNAIMSRPFLFLHPIRAETPAGYAAIKKIRLAPV